MSDNFIRIYKKINFDQVKEHLLIYGDLSAQCACCQAMDLKLDMNVCPKCGNHFKYVAFRNVRQHLPKMHQLKQTRPEIEFIDFDDYKRVLGEIKARNFLK